MGRRLNLQAGVKAVLVVRAWLEERLRLSSRVVLLLELVGDELADLGVLRGTQVSIVEVTVSIEGTYHGGRVEHEITVEVTDRDSVVDLLVGVVVPEASLGNGHSVGDESGGGNSDEGREVHYSSGRRIDGWIRLGERGELIPLPDEICRIFIWRAGWAGRGW